MAMRGGEPDPSALRRHPNRARAFHEAGHAVVCAVEGKALHNVSVTGGARIVEPEEMMSNDFWGVRVALAGFVADQISSGETEPLAIERLASGSGTPGTEHDFKHACRLASQAMDRTATNDAIRDCIVEQLQAVTRMLKDRWRAVEMIATQLMTGGELAGEQVVDLVGQTRPS
ncbi:MAG: hypothetical protein ACHQQS_03245 [Thermoanaerobaculales bacterium]